MTNGVFDAVLGSSNPLNLDFDEKYYLGIAVGLDPELGRVELTAAPYSLNARTVEDGTVTAAKLADHAVTGGKPEDETGHRRRRCRHRSDRGGAGGVGRALMQTGGSISKAAQLLGVEQTKVGRILAKGKGCRWQ